MNGYYEIKWDGYRALAAKHGHSVRLLSLRNKNLSSDFPAIVEAVRGVTADVVLIDGEIVAVDKRGCPSFQMLQNRASLGRDWSIARAVSAQSTAHFNRLRARSCHQNHHPTLRQSSRFQSAVLKLKHN